MVVSFHYINNQLINSGSRIGKVIYKLTSFGWVGVDLFFVLSGFLIGTILMNNRGAKNYFSTFYIRRVVRIIPNYYLLIGLFVMIGLIPFFSSDYFLTGNNVIPVWAYLVMVHNIFIAHLQNFGTHFDQRHLVHWRGRTVLYRIPISCLFPKRKMASLAIGTGHHHCADSKNAI